MVVLLVIVVLIILSLMFGGFQKGTKSGSLSHYQGLGPLASASATAPDTESAGSRQNRPTGW